MNKTPVKILIVDDREENHLSLKSVFEKKNYEFADAYSGKDALRILLKETDFTLIIMDILMPGMDGFETATYISKRKKLKDIPIIFLTAKDVEDQIFKAFDLGAVDYISKPVIPELLRAKVNVFVDLSLKNKTLEDQRYKLKQVNDELKVEIKERRASEKKIKLLNEELNTRLKELEALDAFSYSVAHDFRSPLNNISMIAYLLKKNDLVYKDEQMMEHIEKIDKQVSRLDNLINDLLLFSHHDIMIKKEPVNMRQVVNDVLEELKFANKIREDYEIVVDELPAVHCNRNLIKQVWTNLISNAIKYSSEREKPTIQVRHKLEESLQIFSVIDNGIGFQKSESNDLFKIFNRLESAKKFDGSGVGLALAKRIIEKHGGRIWAESLPGRETVFSFYI